MHSSCSGFFVILPDTIACRSFQEGTGPKVSLVRMLPATHEAFQTETARWQSAPNAVRRCTMILQGCPQSLFASALSCPVGILHQVLPADVERIDSGDSHTPYSDTLFSVGQDNRQRLDSLDDLKQYMMDHRQEVQMYNEVCAHVNHKTVVGLVCSTDHVRKSFDAMFSVKGMPS